MTGFLKMGCPAGMKLAGIVRYFARALSHAG